MCCFLVYKGRDMLMTDLLTKAEQALITQSYHAREREEPRPGVKQTFPAAVQPAAKSAWP